MTVKTIWVCDGCDLEKVVTATNDWKSVAIIAEGFRGYPTCAPDDPHQLGYDLCPDCARRVWDAIHPRTWPRVVKAAPAA